jgi:hypothetical protein
VLREVRVKIVTAAPAPRDGSALPLLVRILALLVTGLALI